jgi:hypothetical protein
MSKFRDVLDELFVSKLGFEFKGESIPTPDIDGKENIISISREYSAKGIDVFVVECKDRIIELQKKTIMFYKSLHPDSHFLFISNNGKVYDLYNVSTSKKLKRITYDEIARNTRLFNERIQFFNAEITEGTVDLKINIEKSFEVNDKVTRNFYREFSKYHKMLQDAISGIKNEDDKQWYASVLMNRIMFIYFLQKHGVIQGNTRYLLDMFNIVKKNKENYYKDFLLPLFFHGFAKRDHDADKKKFIKKYGEVRYLNGGLFYPHEIEYRSIAVNTKDNITEYNPLNTSINIKEKSLHEILEFLDGYTWYLDSRPMKDEDEINPDVLGYIFEQYVNDRSDLGAYYTKEDITGYISKNTIIPFILDKLKEKGFEAPDPNPMITNNEDIEQKILDYLENANNFNLYKTLYFEILKPLSVLDPAVGSGAFLFAALNILLPIYRKTIDKLRTFKEEKKKDAELQELLKTLSEHSEEYFITKQIILNNLYGVDIVEEATEICKLRLFLQLASHLPDITSIEPLPDIDFNIYAGNSLVGGLSWEDLQHTYGLKLFDKTGQKIDLDAIKKEIVELEFSKSKYRKLQQQEFTEKELLGIKDKINSLEFSINNKIDIGVNNPFHWFVEFGEIIKNGGFDIIIGNPPYVEFKKITNYNVYGYKTVECGDLYGYFIERAIVISNRNSRISFILPISLVSTDGFSVVREYIKDNTNENWFSSFAMRPGKLFEGAEKHLCIWISSKGFNLQKTIYSSKYHRWKSEERNKLFNEIKYLKLSENEMYLDTFPKVNTSIEKSILNKIFKHKKLGYQFNSYGKYIIYHTRKLRYFVQFLDKPPIILDDKGKQKVTSELKELKFSNLIDRDVALAAYSSSLFFWFFIILSDCRNLNKREVSNFPLDLNEIESTIKTELAHYSNELMKNLQKNSVLKKMNYAKYGQMTVQTFSPRLSKPIIDKIDLLLGKVYGFTSKETDFILNYDLKYRIGEDEE